MTTTSLNFRETFFLYLFHIVIKLFYTATIRPIYCVLLQMTNNNPTALLLHYILSTVHAENTQLIVINPEVTRCLIFLDSSVYSLTP